VALPTVTNQYFTANLEEAPISDYGVSVTSNGTVSLPAGDTVRNFHGQAVLYNGSDPVGPMVAPNEQLAVASGPPTAPTVVPTPGPTTNGLLRRAKATKGVVNGCDCEVTWGIITGTIYFNKKGTALAKDLSGLATIAAQAAPGVDVLVAAAFGIATLCAQEAQDVDECLAIRFGLTPGFTPVPYSYSGGFCTGSY
jgi:hypothetical protein